jgi:hypothetical protein
MEIPNSIAHLRIEYRLPITCVQSEKGTTYEDVSSAPFNGQRRAVIISYRDVTIWAAKLEVFENQNVIRASGYVLVDDGINLPKHATHAALRFEKGELKLETQQ